MLWRLAFRKALFFFHNSRPKHVSCSLFENHLFPIECCCRSTSGSGHPLRNFVSLSSLLMAHFNAPFRLSFCWCNCWALFSFWKHTRMAMAASWRFPHHSIPTEKVLKSFSVLRHSNDIGGWLTKRATTSTFFAIFSRSFQLLCIQTPKCQRQNRLCDLVLNQVVVTSGLSNGIVSFQFGATVLKNYLKARVGAHFELNASVGSEYSVWIVTSVVCWSKANPEKEMKRICSVALRHFSFRTSR